MDLGRDYAHWTNIYPFTSRPDVPVRVLFFPVAAGTPAIGAATPFVLRNFDRLEQAEVPTIGTRYDAKSYYHGPLPENSPGRPCGTAAEWAGDIDYDTWAAGGYTCDCPPPIMGTIVSSWDCNDGSLAYNQSTGAVVAEINTLHANTWLVGQRFQAGSPSDTPLTLQAFVGQTADWLVMLDGGGNTRFEIKPPFDDASSPRLILSAKSGYNLITFSDSILYMVNGESGNAFRVDVGAQTKMSCGPFWLMPQGLVCWLGARVGVGTQFANQAPMNLPAQLTIDTTLEPDIPAILIWGNVGAGTSAIWQISSAGYAHLEGQLNIHSDVANKPQALWVEAAAGQVGVLITGVGTLQATVDFLQCQQHGVGTLFAVGPNGELKTNQFQAVLVSGQEAGVVPIYDGNGNLLGYIPVYAP